MFWRGGALNLGPRTCVPEVSSLVVKFERTGQRRARHGTNPIGRTTGVGVHRERTEPDHEAVFLTVV